MTFDSVPELARRVLHLEMELKRNKPSHGTDNAALLKRISALESSVAMISKATPTKPQVYTPKPAATVPKPADKSLATKMATLEREVERLKVAADSDKLDGKTLAQVMLSIYPVGAIFTSSNSTNPSTLFGGTWEAYGAGRVLVGKASSGTFATAGATGGSETHTLTVAEMPSHTHTQDAHSHTIPSSASGADLATTRPGDYGNTLTTSSTTATNQNTGGGEAHNNLQPYIVVYMWRRTA